jgi:hypothetical protein
MNHERILQRAMAQEPAASKGAPVSVAGKWVNEYDSSAEFVVSGNSLSGRYVSKAGGVLEGSITGYISGDIIAFSVLWPAAAGSITSWVGQIVDDKGGEILKTLWHLVINIPDDKEPEGLWTSIYGGADEFTRVE